MDRIRYCIGFAAGILDGLGWLRIRNVILGGARSGRGCDGFDRSSDWFVSRWRTRRAIKRVKDRWAEDMGAGQ